MTKITIACGLILVLSFGCCWANGPADETARPNMIFIMADDLGYGDLGCFGQRVIATPRLDQMAAEGMKFTQFYAGNTVCAPSRSVLMTGQHMGHTHVRGNANSSTMLEQSLRAQDVTLGDDDVKLLLLLLPLRLSLVDDLVELGDLRLEAQLLTLGSLQLPFDTI